MIVENAKEEYMDDIVSLENRIWPEEIRAPREKFESRLKIFSDGFFVAFKDREMVGASTAEVINYDPKNPPHSWEDITDNGWIKKTHNPDGNALYVVSVGAASRSGAGKELVEAQKNLTRRLNLDYLVLGSRVPGYQAYYEEKPIDIKEYLNTKDEKDEPVDPLIRFYSRCGLKIVDIVSNYMEDDPESRNYGVVMAWENKE